MEPVQLVKFGASVATAFKEVSFEFDDATLSPFLSDVGITFASSSARLHLHFNGSTRQIGSPFLSVPGFSVISSGPRGVELSHPDGGRVSVTFFGRNRFVLEGVGGEGLILNLDIPGAHVFLHRISAIGDGRLSLIHGVHLPKTDPLEPDDTLPAVVAAVADHLLIEHAVGQSRAFRPQDAAAPWKISFRVDWLQFDAAETLESIMHSPSAVESAQMSERWLSDTLGGLSAAFRTGHEKDALVHAALSLAFDATAGHGAFGERAASFPARGSRPAHFLWDACFQNLALEMMDERLASDSLLLLAENIRWDGKMARSLSPTWILPGPSAPPIFGWAAWRLAAHGSSKELARALLEPLTRNTQWWLTHRAWAKGLVACEDPSELAWCGLQRLEDGPVVAVDINSLLLNQMRCGVNLSLSIGDAELASRLHAKAESMAESILDNLYDPEDGLFDDLDVATGARRPLRTTACLMPYWARVTLPTETAQDALRRWLAIGSEFSELTDSHELSYLMIETLAGHGLGIEAYEASKRLYEHILESRCISRDIHGGTAAILLRLNKEIYFGGHAPCQCCQSNSNHMSN